MSSRTKKAAIGIGALVVALAAALFVQHVVLRKAHSTFEDYYAFRGCSQLIERTPDSGTCRTASGNVIKIVQYRGRWYLDGDLPSCFVTLPDGSCLVGLP
ncbi:MAG: hypothetical protein KGI69_01240 [Patescibacteria group bacterium]|nr:hypothetical protein [Patescibacteria group bacterium]